MNDAKACAIMAVIIGGLLALFVGDPDIADAVIWAMTDGKLAPTD